MERDVAEMRRSAEEAKAITTRKRIPWHPVQVERYLSPPLDTCYRLEYAFHLLGDVRGKMVLDLGCGIGDNIVPLVKRGACVLGMDISPELIELAQERLKRGGIEAVLRVCSAYDTGLPDASVDVIFCINLIHHLDVAAVRDEMHRILVQGGLIILSEPIRFSGLYNRLRNLLPARENISDYEHPLTRNELTEFIRGFEVEGDRYFRLPLLPLAFTALPSEALARQKLMRLDRWILHHWRPARKYATNITLRLRKKSSEFGTRT